jgi:hypothetical protein
MKPLGPVPMSNTLKKVWVKDRRNKIVIDQYTVNNTGLFLRQCTDLDDHIEPEFVDNWADLIYCDFKVRPGLGNSYSLLEQFALNSQAVKILHISLDNPGESAAQLLDSIPAFRKNGKLIVEINDRSETVNSIEAARSLVNFIHFPADHLYYWNSKIDVWGGYGLELSDTGSQPEYY